MVVETGAGEARTPRRPLAACCALHCMQPVAGEFLGRGLACGVLVWLSMHSLPGLPLTLTLSPQAGRGNEIGRERVTLWMP